LWCWGWEFQGAHGVGNSGGPTTHTTPVQENTLSTDWAAISHNGSTTCGIRHVAGERQLWCWGYNFTGMLGDGTRVRQSSPQRTGGDTDWQNVWLSDSSYTAALRTDGTLWTWGRNGRGVFGLGEGDVQRTPRREAHGFADWVQVVSGGYATCGLRDVGGARQLWCWGHNNAGQLGNGTLIPEAMAVPVGAATDWLDGDGDEEFICLRNSAGALYCVGANADGNLGIGSFTDANTLTRESTSASDWAEVGTGAYHALGIRDDGTDRTLWVWGNNDDGQLGLGAAAVGTSLEDPTALTGATDWLAVAAGDSFSCGQRGVAPSRTIQCWGINSRGQLGKGDSGGGTDLDAPGAVVSGGHDWRTFAVGASHACGITAANDLYCWGANDVSQAGPNTGTNQVTPQPVGPSGVWQSLSAGFAFNCALNDSAALLCWGSNATGALGYGGLTDRETPVMVDGAPGWQKVSAGSEHACAIRQDGLERTLWCWGRTTDGALGSGEPWRLVPGQVSDPG